jgi:hypothetical protein
MGLCPSYWLGTEIGLPPHALLGLIESIETHPAPLQIYHGRLYFGDANSGEVVWDCDCRPSDGGFVRSYKTARRCLRKCSDPVTTCQSAFSDLYWLT